MIYCQTFSADLIDSLDKEELQYMLVLHFMSALSISKYLQPDDDFILITDSKGKKLIDKKFPYTKVLTALDSYPYVRPLKMSAYKLYSIDLFRGEDFVHFDNDVYLFKPIPAFKNVIVQSNEGYFIRVLYHNKLKDSNYVLPEFTRDILNNYNPGVFGFKHDSNIREKYWQIFLEYSNSNIEKYNSLPQGIEKDLFLLNMQDVYCVLEEGVLFHLTQMHNADVTEVIGEKYKNQKGVWGTFKNQKYRNINWERIIDISHHSWRKHDYCHFVSQKDDRNFHVQEVLLELYRTSVDEVNRYLQS